ncbi:Maf family protein [Stenotrophomonas panacihumi]|uniref:Maf family protein n=1 Tax=Stenotrophomonas panacihumi TaxID=676599 RepID=UPI000D368FAA|nr:Maf family nucleotide pyrophosphatase [Stenotrophomonas panacihumi]PTN54464.1 septum formation inhibitor Maf [Stenotrophomonas panacihumi]
MPRLILASTSPYRRELLTRLGLPFETARPETDETPAPGEAPPTLAARLARAKALALATPDAWVIGSDQVAELDGAPLGKPGTFAAAQAQLSSMSGRRVRFHTAVCVAGPDGLHETVDLTEVHFRPLSAEEIDRYLHAESPLDCAGSFKCEGLGISLFEAIDNRDPTALVGLPLIATARLLREAGFRIP